MIDLIQPCLLPQACGSDDALAITSKNDRFDKPKPPVSTVADEVFPRGAESNGCGVKVSVDDAAMVGAGTLFPSGT